MSTDPEIILPEREYGYRETPLLWDELVDIILREKNLAKLSRSVPQQTEYELYMRQLKIEWKSIYDFILCSKFGFDKQRINGSWEAIQPNPPGLVRKALVLNDFPYYNAPGIFHYILWKIGADITPDEIEKAKQDLKQSLGDVEDLLHWNNPPHLKSLPDIDHIHILCKRHRKGKNDVVALY